MDSNKVQQNEEIEALCAIYGSDWSKETDNIDSYRMSVNRDIQLFVTLNSDYPASKPPAYQLLAPTLNGEQKQQIHAAFDKIYKDNAGMPVLFQWIETLKEIITEEFNGAELAESSLEEQETFEAIKPVEHVFNIIHGSIIQDRKSTFQGHACTVSSQQEVREVMEILLQNKKVAQATHNILAYRITSSNGSLLQDCDDDGETHAGSRLLHLLQILDINNVVVVVTRWYGGIHLGPDRFRHINNSARQVLQQAGFLKDKTT